MRDNPYEAPLPLEQRLGGTLPYMKPVKQGLHSLVRRKIHFSQP